MYFFLNSLLDFHTTENNELVMTFTFFRYSSSF